ncbi:uncharacterized protein LOC128222973 isoform X2 [Mya arenaria]|uniref:uncharacterized protein LOC128222973 isoform X2 n=1 Tax=Mya arenaria TaxID=6604 RepID=UPI0022E7A888|nr:uncharacterized protein LOC128222973 isoform X2 [Mya arenaria]
MLCVVVLSLIFLSVCITKSKQARCPEIQIENGEIGYMGNREIYHMAYIKKCADGYTFDGSQVAECLPTLRWDNDLRCIKTLPKCPELMTENGEVTYIGGRERYTFAHITCNEGYSIDKDGVETVECLQSLQWENNLNCYKPCDTPTIENGILRSDIFNVKYSKATIKSGQSVSVSCEAGYALYDNKKDDFLEESTWPIKCAYGYICSFNSDCHHGLVCFHGKCRCDKSYTYDLKARTCKKICRGTNDGFYMHGTSNAHYDSYKDRYTNCSYVHGNLELTYLKGPYDLGFLSDIEEISGYVFIVNVYSYYLNLTKLRIVRGTELFHYRGVDFSLFVANNYDPFNDTHGLLELQLISLTEISRGKVLFLYNNLLCFENTIRWDDINSLTRTSVNAAFISKLKRRCPDCSEECYNRQTGDSHCWGSAPGMCQKLNFISAVCDSSCDGRCFGKEQDECCHPECTGGCVGPGREQCLACKNFYFEGSCHPYCPRMKMFDPSTHQVVNNPDGRYAFGSLCVKDCPPYLVKENDACVIECPAYKSANPNTSICQPCFENCPEKPCRLNHEKGRHFLQFGNVLVKEAPHGTIVTVFCENGFDKDESNDASYSDIQCLRGQFEKMYHCFERCEIPQIENSEVSKLNNQSRSALKHGETIKVTCQKGFILSNPHAYGRYDGTHNGSELTLTCTNGTLIGMEGIMCLRQYQLENRSHKGKLNCTAPHSDDVQLYSLSSEKLAAGTVINHGKAIIAEMTCENGDEELDNHIENFQPNEDGNPSQTKVHVQLTCTNGVIPDYDTLSCSAGTTDPQVINPNECKILPNGTVTDSGQSFECNHGYAYADRLLYERYSCSCNREIPALVCSGKQAQCKPINCKLNGSIEHGLTVMYKGLIISATAIEAIDHGESAVFNCESGGNGETYEPKLRIFKCDIGNWVVENGIGESWSLGNNGSFPECRPAKCECQNGGTCIRDETCKCSSFSTGQQCETPLCPIGCQNGGTCTFPNTCSCPERFSGTRCQTETLKPWKPDNSYYLGNKDEYLEHHETYKFRCNSNFELKQNGRYLSENKYNTRKVEVENLNGGLKYDGKKDANTLSCVEKRCFQMDQSKYPNVIIQPKTKYVEHGQSYHLSCENGYEHSLESDPDWTCSFGKLNGIFPHCTEKPCDTPAVKNGVLRNFHKKYSKPTIVSGDIVLLQCSQGFFLYDNSKNEFMEEHVFRIKCYRGNITSIPSCKKASRCELPNDPYASYYVNGEIYRGNNTISHKDKVDRVECESGTSLTKPLNGKNRCWDGNWKLGAELPVCEPDPCGLNEENGRHFISINGKEVESEVAHGNKVNVVCDDGDYDIVGNDEDSNSEIQCLKGKFDKMYHCVERCTIPDISNATTTRSNGTHPDKLKHGENVSVSCEDEFIFYDNKKFIEEGSFIMTCASGKIPSIPSCRKALNCSLPRDPYALYYVNGEKHIGATILHESKVHVECENGTSLIVSSDDVRTCRNGDWKSREPFPVCVQGCAIPDIPNANITRTNGKHTDKLKHGENITVTCHEGYSVQNSEVDDYYLYLDYLDDDSNDAHFNLTCKNGTIGNKKCELSQDSKDQQENMDPKKKPSVLNCTIPETTDVHFVTLSGEKLKEGTKIPNGKQARAEKECKDYYEGYYLNYDDDDGEEISPPTRPIHKIVNCTDGVLSDYTLVCDDGARYRITVKTADIKWWTGEGTDGEVYLYMYGSKGSSGKIILDGKFEAGYKDIIVGDFVDVGEINKIQIGVKALHSRFDGWKLESVLIEDVSRSAYYNFIHNLSEIDNTSILLHRVASCSPPAGLRNVNPFYVDGHTLYLDSSNCAEGYIPNSSSTKCTATGWTINAVCSQIVCSPPAGLRNVHPFYVGGQTLYLDSSKCAEGYIPNSSSTKCTASGWTINVVCNQRKSTSTYRIRVKTIDFDKDPWGGTRQNVRVKIQGRQAETTWIPIWGGFSGGRISETRFSINTIEQIEKIHLKAYGNVDVREKWKPDYVTIYVEDTDELYVFRYTKEEYLLNNATIIYPEASCSPPAGLRNVNPFYIVDDTLYLDSSNCAKGYIPNSSSTKCTATGWTINVACNQIFCSPPAGLRNVHPSYLDGHTLYLDSSNCAEGYIPNSSSTKCTASGWTINVVCNQRKSTSTYRIRVKTIDYDKDPWGGTRQNVRVKIQGRQAETTWIPIWRDFFPGRISETRFSINTIEQIEKIHLKAYGNVDVREKWKPDYVTIYVEDTDELYVFRYTKEEYLLNNATIIYPEASCSPPAGLRNVNPFYIVDDTLYLDSSNCAKGYIPNSSSTKCTATGWTINVACNQSNML